MRRRARMERPLIERARKGVDDDRAGAFVDIQPIHTGKNSIRVARERTKQRERMGQREQGRKGERARARGKRTRERRIKHARKRRPE